MTTSMTPGLRKFSLTAHVASSVGLLGSIAAFLSLAIAGLTSQDAQTAHFAYPAMELIARFVIVPLAFAALLTGLVQSLGTPWGLFQHWWIVAKLSITVFATIILLIKMPLIGYAAQLAQETILPSAALHSAGLQLVVHAAGGLLILLVPTILSVYKPRGLTAYGGRIQESKHAPSQRHSVDPTRDKGLRSSGSITLVLRRAHALGFIALVVAVHVVILHVSSGGLGHH